MYNCKIKWYGDYYNSTICNKPIFKGNSDIDIQKNEMFYPDIVDDEIVLVDCRVGNRDRMKDNVQRSCKRAKERIFDLVYLNTFDYFITLTFNPNKVDSYSSYDVMINVQRFFRYAKKFDNSLRYIIVPEYHKSGRIHIHALVSSSSFFNFVDSTHRDKNGHVVYNISNFRYGYSTAIKIYDDNKFRLANYVTKYVIKDFSKIFGKYFWSSHNLEREVNTEFLNVDYDNIDKDEYLVPNSNIRIKYDSYFPYTKK